MYYQFQKHIFLFPTNGDHKFAFEIFSKIFPIDGLIYFDDFLLNCVKFTDTPKPDYDKSNNTGDFTDEKKSKPTTFHLILKSQKTFSSNAENQTSQNNVINPPSIENLYKQDTQEIVTPSNKLHKVSMAIDEVISLEEASTGGSPLRQKSHLPID